MIQQVSNLQPIYIIQSLGVRAQMFFSLNFISEICPQNVASVVNPTPTELPRRVMKYFNLDIFQTLNLYISRGPIVWMFSCEHLNNDTNDYHMFEIYRCSFGTVAVVCSCL